MDEKNTIEGIFIMPVKVERLTGKKFQRAVEGFNEKPHARRLAQSLPCVTTSIFLFLPNPIGPL